MTKEKLAKMVLTEEELKQIDYALPQPYVDHCNVLDMPDPRPYQVWMYTDSIGGEPINLAERFVEKFSKLPHIIGNADVDKEAVGAMYVALNHVNEMLGWYENENT